MTFSKAMPNSFSRSAALLIGALVVSVPCAFAQAQTSKPVAIRVAGDDGTNSATPFFTALRLGLFQDAGLDVTFTTIGGGAPATAAAMRAGEIDVAVGGGGEYMTFVAKGLVPGKLIGQFTDNNYVILGREGITDIKQLKGKVFGISSISGGDHVYSEAVLAHFGIKTDDVTWLTLGNPATRLSALLTSKVDGIEMALTSMPENAKSRIILGADESPVPYIANAIFARQEFITARKPELQKFVAMIGKAADLIRKDPATGLRGCMDSGSSEAVCKNVIQVATSSKNPYTWSSTAKLHMEAIEAMIPIVGISVPQALKLTPKDYVEASIAEPGK